MPPMGRRCLDRAASALHVMHMNTTHIQIRNVPAAIHRKLKSRAAAQDMTITDYVKRLIARDLERPPLDELLKELRSLPPVATASEIVDLIREDRDSR